MAGARVPRPVGARVPRARLVGRSPRDRRMTQARASGRKGAKPLRMAGAWPRHPGLPGHPGVSGGGGALITRQQLTGAKHPSACEPPTLGCPGCLGCPGRPPSNGIPCGRHAHWKRHPPRAVPAHQPIHHPSARIGGRVRGRFVFSHAHHSLSAPGVSTCEQQAREKEAENDNSMCFS